jgi:hypothetical protein
MFFPCDGPSVEDEISVGAVTPTELKVGASPLRERKVVTFQPQGGRIRWGFTNGISSSKGYIAFNNQIVTVEAADTQGVYVIAESGTVDVYFSERA